MPAYLTHEQLAKKAAERLTAGPAAVALRGRDEFLLGAQGPDMFFYMPMERLFPGVKLLQYARKIHGSVPKELFCGAAALLRARYSESSMAYFMGFLTHYALDRAVHPLVGEYARGSRTLHNELERDIAVHFFGEAREGLLSSAVANRADCSLIEKKAAALLPASRAQDGFHHELARRAYGLWLPERAFSRACLASKDFWGNMARGGAGFEARLKIFGKLAKTDFASLRPERASPLSPSTAQAVSELIKKAAVEAAALCEAAWGCVLGAERDTRLAALIGNIDFNGKAHT